MTQPKLEPGQHTVRLNLHLSERMKKNIERMAESRGVSYNEVVRQIIADSEDYKMFENNRN